MTSALRWGSVLVCAGLLLAGCKTGASAKAGAGDPVNICDGIDLYNGLAEPSQTDAKAVLSYLDAVDRVLERIDGDKSYKSLKAKEEHPPQAILDQVAGLRKTYQTLRTQVPAATTPAALQLLLGSFASAPTFSAADHAVELWTAGECA